MADPPSQDNNDPGAQLARTQTRTNYSKTAERRGRTPWEKLGGLCKLLWRRVLKSILICLMLGGMLAIGLWLAGVLLFQQHDHFDKWNSTEQRLIRGHLRAVDNGLDYIQRLATDNKFLRDRYFKSSSKFCSSSPSSQQPDLQPAASSQRGQTAAARGNGCFG